MKTLIWLSLAHAGPDPAAGRALWYREVPAPDGGAPRSCAACHGPTPQSAGEHVTTGEPIEPMTAPGRFTDPAKVEKWFGRNCRWTLGRECTPEEKANVTAWLTGRTP
jgi:hypothetical protein